MRETKADTTVRLVISSEIRLIDLVHQASEKVAEIAGFDAEDALNVGLALREAVINAIVHGNREDPSLKVFVTLTVGRRGLKAKVRDQGEGFDPEGRPDPTTMPNLLDTSGRGLLLMRAFVDDVKFHQRPQRGMEITLTKKLVRSNEESRDEAS